MRPIQRGTVAAIAATLAVGVLPAVTDISPSLATAGSGAGTRWVTSWAASPSDASWPVDPTLTLVPDALCSQTIRNVITPHLRGSTLRIHLSNHFGTSPTTFGHVTVGRQTSGAEVAGNTTVTFGGMSSVVAPAGADVVSDPVAMTVSAFTPLAVSVYVPCLAGSITKHWNANATSYYTLPLSGDRTTESSGDAFLPRTKSWLYLSGLDVTASAPTRAIVTIGDSITDGFVGGSPVSLPASTVLDDANGRYPDVLQHRLDSAGIPITVINAGVSGNQLLTSSAITGPSGVSRLSRDALGQAGVSGVLLQEGINDLGLGHATAGELKDGYTQVINQVHAAGLKIWLGTILPASNSVTNGVLVAPSSDTSRQELNAWIRTQTLADGVVDFDATLRNPENKSTLAPQFASVDNLHPSPAGYQAMAGAVALPMLAASTPPQ